MPATGGTTREPRSASRIVLLVFGSLVGLLGLAVLAGGAAALWADTSKRDDAGYFTTSTERFATDTHAIVYNGLDADVPGWAHERSLVTIRVRATSVNPDRRIFVGVAPTSSVATYLGGVERTRAENVDFDPFRVDYVRVAGSAQPARPDTQSIWAASGSGAGTVSVKWPLKEGDWSVVVMNADGSRNVAADIRGGTDIRYLGWVAGGLTGGGLIVLAAGVFLVIVGGRRPRTPGAAAVAAPEAAAS
jgi:hypothetical protein